MSALSDLIEQEVRGVYRQAWDDCMTRFGIKPVVADLKHMKAEQDREVATVRFHLAEALGFKSRKG